MKTEEFEKEIIFKAVKFIDHRCAQAFVILDICSSNKIFKENDINFARALIANVKNLLNIEVFNLKDSEKTIHLYCCLHGAIEEIANRSWTPNLTKIVMPFNLIFLLSFILNGEIYLPLNILSWEPLNIKKILNAKFSSEELTELIVTIKKISHSPLNRDEFLFIKETYNALVEISSDPHPIF